ncbi:MAG: winged helix-turn-helix domain-containing protein [Thermoplasmatota archaeon]
MGEGAFDIYQTDAGYAAVTNPVQRQILDALRGRELQLPDLVKVTGRSKPTLSSLHMKELLSRELIEERGHPTDSRRKVYRLKAAKIGSSDIPVAQLRDAVQHYVSLSPLAARLPLKAIVEALCAAPAGTDPKVVWSQAHRLGTLAAGSLKVASVRDLWMRLAGFLEAEEVAQPVRIDLERGVLELRNGAALKGNPTLAPALLGGLVEGVAQGKGLALSRVKATATADGVRLQSS